MKFDLDHELHGVRIEDSFRGEFYDSNTRRTNLAFNVNGGAITDRVNYSDGNWLSYEDSTNGIVMDLTKISGDGSVGTGAVLDGFGNTDTLLGSTPHVSASSRRYALGVKTCAARRSCALRATRSALTKTP